MIFIFHGSNKVRAGNQFVEEEVTGMGNHALVTKILHYRSPIEYPHMECMEAGYNLCYIEAFIMKVDCL